METNNGNHSHENHLFVWLGAGFALLAVGVAVSTYVIPLAAGSYTGSPLRQLYTVLLVLWPLFFLLQAVFASSNQLRNHRSFGMAGISLATALEFAGCAVMITALEDSRASGANAGGLAGTASSFVGLLMFIVFFAWAMVRRRRIDVHKRMQLLATLALMQQVTTEVTMVPSVDTSFLLSVVVLAIVSIRDFYIRQRVHSVYLAGGLVLLVVQGGPWLWVNSALWRGIVDGVLVFGR